MIFKIAQTNPTPSWSFNYEITEETVLLADFEVISVSVVGDYGSTSGIINTPGSYDGTGSVSVGFAYSYVDMKIFLKDLPGSELQVKLVVLNVTDGSCANSNIFTTSHGINTMPIVSNFN